MPNILFELDRLRTTLRNKGLDANTVEGIIRNANSEIARAFEEHADVAMQLAIESGVNQKSSDFINELKLDAVNMQLITDSGNMEFSEPPYPMLSKLLQNAQPIKDGSGVYKVIPVGTPGKDRPKVSTNIYDVYKQINAERIENAKKQYTAITPRGSAAQFRTATSKQDPNTQWVKPAQTKDFTEQMSSINRDLTNTMDTVVRDIIRSYEEGF